MNEYSINVVLNPDYKNINDVAKFFLEYEEVESVKVNGGELIRKHRKSDEL